MGRRTYRHRRLQDRRNRLTAWPGTVTGNTVHFQRVRHFSYRVLLNWRFDSSRNQATCATASLLRRLPHHLNHGLGILRKYVFCSIRTSLWQR